MIVCLHVLVPSMSLFDCCSSVGYSRDCGDTYIRDHPPRIATMALARAHPDPQQAPDPQLVAPKFVRHDVFSLNSLEIEDKNTGWRSPSSERVDELTETFSEGGCGISVICDIRALGTKSAAGHRLGGDGVSTIRALVRCLHCFQAPPNSSRRKEALVSVLSRHPHERLAMHGGQAR
jgi:hypothetical protein